MIHSLYSNLLDGQKSICGEGWIGWLKICMVDKITQVIIILDISELHFVLVRLDLHLGVRHNLDCFIKMFQNCKILLLSKLCKLFVPRENKTKLQIIQFWNVGKDYLLVWLVPFTNPKNPKTLNEPKHIAFWFVFGNYFLIKK